MYIDTEDKLQLRPDEVSCAEDIVFNDDRYMTKPSNFLNEALLEAFRDLSERVAEQDQRELALIVNEKKMKDLRAKCIQILSATFDIN